MSHWFNCQCSEAYVSLLCMLIPLFTNAAAPDCTDCCQTEKDPYYEWYFTEPHSKARQLSQLTEEEFKKYSETDLLDVQPVIVPDKSNVATINDYLYWPIATHIGDTILVLYAQKPHHFRNRVETDIHYDGFTGIRKIVRSTDKGKTWSDPLDLHDFGKWDPEQTPFSGWNAGMGVHEGIVYIGIKEGIYRSLDQGASWQLLMDEPSFGELPLKSTRMGMRITFDKEHGMVLWCTDMKRVRRNKEGYGGVIRAVYSPDFGKTWKYQDQPIPEEFIFSEITPLQWKGKIVLFNRNPQNAVPGPYVQCTSETGWFPFDIRSSGIEHGRQADTPDIIFNPETMRFEAAVSMRLGINEDGPTGCAKVNLYSISPDDLFSKKPKWRFDGTWIRYRGPWGIMEREKYKGNGFMPGAEYVDGFNPVGGFVLDGKHFLYVWGGDGIGQSAIYQYTRDLDTDAVRNWLLEFSLDASK